MNEKYLMTHAERLNLIKEAVLYCQKVSGLGMPSKCYAKALREPIFFLWELRNTNKKHEAALYRSRSSLELVAGQGQLIYDHAVPFNYLQKELLLLNSVTTENVECILLRHGVACLITKDEDNMLNQSGLGRKMPDDWDGNDCLARYRAIGIEIIKNPYHKSEQLAGESA